MNYFKFGPVIQEEMSFKEKVYAQQKRPITTAHLEPLEGKRSKLHLYLMYCQESLQVEVQKS